MSDYPAPRPVAGEPGPDAHTFRIADRYHENGEETLHLTDGVIWLTVSAERFDWATRTAREIRVDQDRRGTVRLWTRNRDSGAWWADHGHFAGVPLVS